MPVGEHQCGCWDEPPHARHGARAWLGQAADPGRWEVLLGPAPAHTDTKTTATSQNRTPPLTWLGLKMSNPDGFGLCLPRVLLLAPGSPPQAMPAKAIPSPSSGAGAAIAGGQNVPPSEAGSPASPVKLWQHWKWLQAAPQMDRWTAAVLQSQA